MGDYTTPWGSISGTVRDPTTDEQQGGFPCGQLDRALWNKLLQALEAEVGNVSVEAGLTQNTGDENLKDAILALIAAATGGGTADNYVLMTQARARLPIFPEVLTNDGRMDVIVVSPGTVRIPASKTFLHRGIFSVTSSLTNLSTTGSKTYHIRWNPVDGFGIYDLANAGYNPSTLLETNPAFDSTYDDMLIARVTTTSGNVATITNLANLPRMQVKSDWRGIVGDTLNWAVKSATGVTMNWARSPLFEPTVMINEFRSTNSGPDENPTPAARGDIRNVGVRLLPCSRYTIPNFEYYYEDTKTGTSTGDGMLAVTINAISV